MVIFIRKSTYFVLFYYLTASIDTIFLLILRSLYIYLSALIYLTSYQAQQIFTSYAFPSSLALTFYKRFFNTLFDILAYI